MKKKVLVLMLTAGMLTSGLAANTFASDSNEEFTQFAEETESTEGMTAESVDSDLDFVDAGEAKETEESGDIFSDTEDFTTGTEISDADSSGEMQESEQEVTPIPSAEPTPTIAPSTEPEPTAMPTPTPTVIPFSLTYQSGSMKWENHTTVSLKFSTTQDCKWYYFYVDSGTDITVIQNMHDSSRATNSEEANTEFTVKAENVPETDSWLVICAKPYSGKAKMSLFKLDNSSFKNKRPKVPTPTPSRPLRIYKVTQSTVKGLEKPLKFTPGKFYNFTVTGAGMDNKSPISGDVRWVPMYWSTRQNPTGVDKNTVWRIGSPKGIREKKTYNIYIFFKKQIYNGKSWKDSDVIQSMTQKFTSAALTDEDLGIYHMKVNTKSVVLRAGQSTSAVKVTNATSSFRVVAWYSANTSIARVNAQGRITAGKKTGSTYITIVMSTGEKTKVKVTVQNGTVRTNAIYGLKTKYTVTKGKTLTLRPVLSPVTSQERITYSSSNKNVATVSSKGVIKGIKTGTARITVKSGSKKVTITVIVPKVSTQKISGINSAITLLRGKTSQLKPKLSPSNSDDKISYSTSDSKVVTVNAKGVITAKRKGTAVITVKSGKVQTKCKVTVK